MATEKTLHEQVRDAFDATGPEALEALFCAFASRIEALESALDKATAPAPASAPATPL